MDRNKVPVRGDIHVIIVGKVLNRFKLMVHGLREGYLLLV